jgi:class 3 adenylate cyclase/tetratricopeptide (TPR) repeat protein
MPEERKLVSILFADVVGSTALADELDAEDVRALMSRYYEHARRVITPYGGTLEKFIGDAIMAVFGLAQVHGDDAERALAAALALREAIATDEVLVQHIQLRVGVNTGEVVATSDPRSLDFLVTGDAVNVAARLQQGAQPGEIVASERTVQAARKAFLFAEARELQARGKPQPLRIFPLKGPHIARQMERPPFVGRRQDLLQLDLLKERTLEEGRPQLALVVAPAGTGKSRLLETFLDRLNPSEGFQVAFARCLPYGQTLTYWPLRGLLSELLGSEPTRESVQAIFLQRGYQREDAARLAELVLTTQGVEEKSQPDTGEASAPLAEPPETGFLKMLSQPATWTTLEERLNGLDKQFDNFDPFKIDDWLKETGLTNLGALNTTSGPSDMAGLRSLGRTLKKSGLALGNAINEKVAQTLRETLPGRSRGSERESIFTAWRLLIEALAIQTPRVIVFEDLHWANDNLLDLIEYSMYQQTSASLLLIALGRPELLDRRPAWGSGRQNATLLTLQPLGEQQTRELLASLGETLPEAICDQIVARSGGNPFFALELLHAFHELRLRGEVDHLAPLPDTVHAAVLARIDLLTQQERTALQIASVVSRSFSPALLHAVLDTSSSEEIQTAIDGLLARDLLVQIANDTYDFRHMLIRDVAYGTLSRTERIRMHSAIARWMGSRADEHLDQYVELIAYHYREAYQLSRQSAVPLALPFKPEEVVPLFERAARLATRSGSFAEANNHFLLAIELAPATEHARLHEERGDSVSWSGSTPYEAYKQALDCWRAAGAHNPSSGARLIRKVLNAATRAFFFTALQPSETAALRTEGLQLAIQGDNPDEQWRLRVSECFDPRYMWAKSRKAHQAELPALRENALQAAAYFEQQQNWTAMSEALDGCTGITIYLYRWQEALELSRRRLAIPDLPPEEWVDVIFSSGLIYFWQGDYASTVATIQNALAGLKPGHPIASLGKLINILATTFFLTGQWDEVLKLLPRLHEIRERVQYDQHASASLGEGYSAVLQVALAREDQPMIDSITTILRQYTHLQGPTSQDYLAVLLANSPAHITFSEEPLTDGFMNTLLCFYNEHGEPLPETFLNQIQDPELLPNSMAVYLHVSLALQTNDPVLLARAIDEAEARQLPVHAARMRIILARHSRNPQALEQARPVLARLGDRQFLRHLEEVASSL